MLRVVLPLTLALAAGCAIEHQVADVRDELSVVTSGELSISADGPATLITPAAGLQTTVVDPATLADLHAEIVAARFPTLAPFYGCTGLCPQIASTTHTVTVLFDGRPITVVVVNDFYIRSHPDKVPPALVAVIDSLNDIFLHSDWH